MFFETTSNSNAIVFRLATNIWELFRLVHQENPRHSGPTAKGQPKLEICLVGDYLPKLVVERRDIGTANYNEKVKGLFNSECKMFINCYNNFVHLRFHVILERHNVTNQRGRFLKKIQQFQYRYTQVMFLSLHFD